MLNEVLYVLVNVFTSQGPPIEAVATVKIYFFQFCIVLITFPIQRMAIYIRSQGCIVICNVNMDAYMPTHMQS